MRLLRSSLLADLRPRVTHGFSTRLGGVSIGPHASLNLGRAWGDDPACVDENLRRLADEGGFDAARLVTCRQVHGARCLRVDGQGSDLLRDEPADAMVTCEPGRTLGIRTADCVPIVFADDEGRVGAAHAGWRGTVAEVAAATVAALEELGARRERIRAALGPSIGPCCFEVGEEVADAFARLVPEAVLSAPGRKPHVDLRLANRVLLVRAGLRPEHTDATPPCTMCDGERFFSYRRDGAGIGQMLSFVVVDGGAQPGANSFGTKA